MPAITENTKLREIVEAYPNFIERGSVKFPVLKKAKGLAWLAVRNMTVKEAANKANMPVSDALAKINEVIAMC